ncbi:MULTISPECIES: septum formation family protein [unclassified Microbacterium]|uniref:septum formation family protein n=1 Tax=unclassified Microbacterium TaxID=2609290 RepID=UPI00214B8D3B|nr:MULTISPECIES: septum formation family protein [unclassified Microbacterium]MCR2800548.1 septum formation family protein [Microbacterium sp. zg.Y818]MCR2827923.1 septum formation family protein [Microbacterium sp. zg.Y909]WIM23277.1 septum formation family protein [Microbacterium sp. zg-Y818]
MKFARPQLALAGLVVLGMTTLTACSAASLPDTSSEPVRDAESGQVTESSEAVDVFAIRVGDCLNTSELTGETELESVPVVPCEEPHEDEVYHAFDVEGSEYPGTDALAAEADETCIAEFGTFVGTPWEESALEYWPMYPSEQSWAGGDREILCIAYDPSQLVTGTLAGAAR